MHREGGKKGTISTAVAQATSKEVDKARSAGGKKQDRSNSNDLQVSTSIHKQKRKTNSLHGPHHHPAPVLSTGYRAMHDVGSAEEAIFTAQATPPTSRRQKQAKAKDRTNRKAHLVDERARKSAAARPSIAASSP